MTLRLQLRCSRCLDTSGFLTSRQQTLRLQLCRSPSRGFDARRYFLASGLLPLRLQSCCSQLRGLLAFSLHSRSLDTCRFFPKVGLPFRGLNPRRLQLIRLVWPMQRLAPERPGRFAPVLDRRDLDAPASRSPGSKRSVLP